MKSYLFWKRTTPFKMDLEEYILVNGTKVQHFYITYDNRDVEKKHLDGARFVLKYWEDDIIEGYKWSNVKGYLNRLKELKFTQEVIHSEIKQSA